MKTFGRALPAWILLCSTVSAPTWAATVQEPEAGVQVAQNLKQLSLEELMNMEVTSLSKKPERLREAAAAVYVISSEDIRRSGVTNTPDALRLAPGVDVARIDANKWSIGIRGFGSRLSRSMLALMDGRSLYSPLFAGVYWEVQDTLLEDVERIEVIRGPGGTLWGANAVNGIVNIITKSAKDTQGTYLEAGGGDQESGFGAVRYGGRAGESTYYRLYGKYFDRSAGFSPGAKDYDAWNMGRFGFRSDTDLQGGDTLTIQGDTYDGRSGQRQSISQYTPPFVQLVQQDSDLSGSNLLGRWKHQTGASSDIALQVYFDQTYRRDPNFQERRNTYDVDFQGRLHPLSRHELIWGVGYRLSSDFTSAIPTVRFTPADRDLKLYSAFVQDEMRFFEDRLRLTVGSKFEHNDYTGFEFQPNVRLLWNRDDTHAAWASVTRAVRTPSRIERDLVLDAFINSNGPTFARLLGTDDFVSEKIVAYEAGYRVAPAPGLVLDAAAFYDRYSGLLGIDLDPVFLERSPPPPHFVLPVPFRNKLDGNVYGGELSAEASVREDWRLGLSYSYLHLQLHGDSFQASGIASTEGSSPRHQASLRSALDLPHNLELDGWLRYVDRLPAQKAPSYVTMDVRLGWHVRRGFEVSLVGQNLLQRHHLEFGSGVPGLQVEVQRSAYAKLAWKW